MGTKRLTRALLAGFVLLAGGLGTASPAQAGDGRGVDILGEVGAYYKQGLKREADFWGLVGYAGQVAGHCRNNLGSVGHNIFTSPEFHNAHWTWEARVDALYRGLLDREPDAGGRQGWLNAIYGGMPWHEVVSGFVNSSEYAGRRDTVCNRPNWPNRTTFYMAYASQHWSSPKNVSCYDITDTKHWCRDVHGWEGVSYSNAADYTINISSVQRAENNGWWGATIGTKNGNFYEGCQRRDDTYWRCDTFTPRTNVEGIERQAASTGYYLRVLKDWAYKEVYVQLGCVYSVVGLWMGMAEWDAVATDCQTSPYYRGG